jgi:hypothetical protein
VSNAGTYTKLPRSGIGGEVANALVGAAAPYESMESRPSRASGRAGHRAKGARNSGHRKTLTDSTRLS